MQISLSKKFSKPLPRLIRLVTVGMLGTATIAYLATWKSTSKVDIADLTIPVESQILIAQTQASGTVRPIQTVNISPTTSGRLAELNVEQGDWVDKDQIIARMENQEIQAQLLQAQANLSRSQARLAELRAGNRPEEIALALARLDQTEARLAELRAGSRPEEIAQAKAQVEAAQAKDIFAAKRLKRYQSLREEGAVSQDELDEMLAEQSSAQANLKEAQHRLAQMINGTRLEEIVVAQAEVREARHELEILENGTRPEIISQAQAEVAQAHAQFQAVQAQAEDAVVRAPFSGQITQRYADLGAFVTPTTSASTTASATSTSIVALAKGLEILAEVPEVDIGQIQVGQQVKILADTYPEEVFNGRVRLIAPAAVQEQSVTSFQVRVDVEIGKRQLMYGMNVNLTFLGDEIRNAIVVPSVAVLTQDGQTGVLVPDKNNKPQFQSVTIGAVIGNKTQILHGVEIDERVFIDSSKNISE